MDVHLYTWQALIRALDDMEKVNSQVSAFVEEVTEAHRQKAEVVHLALVVSAHALHLLIYLLKLDIMNPYILTQ